jgi:hypothetical protein
MFYGPEMLSELAKQFPQLKKIVLNVKDAMKTVASYGVPLTVGGTTAAALYNNK